ncbi:MAG: hypothetical protein KH155_07745, partial [Clostridium sp.]|nr:hypothetical protein [Clostridium sp.]
QPLEASLTSSPFGCLSDRSGVPLSDSSIIIPRQPPFVNTFFALFLTFFEKSGFFPFSSLFLLSLSFVIAIKIKVLYNKPCF